MNRTSFLGITMGVIAAACLSMPASANNASNGLVDVNCDLHALTTVDSNLHLGAGFPGSRDTQLDAMIQLGDMRGDHLIIGVVDPGRIRVHATDWLDMISYGFIGDGGSAGSPREIVRTHAGNAPVAPSFFDNRFGLTGRVAGTA